MTGFGFDIDENAPAVCSVRTWENGCTAAIHLIAFGPEPAKQSVLPDAKQIIVHNVCVQLEKIFEKCYREQKMSDLRLLSMHLGQTLKKANTMIRDLNKELGQGIYLGGNILFVQEKQIFVFSFGGCSAISEANGNFFIQGKPELGKISRTALGTAENWEDVCWFNTVQDNSRILLLSSTIANPTPILQLIQEYDLPGAHPNTLAMALRRWLSEIQKPAAVIALQL